MSRCVMCVINFGVFRRERAGHAVVVGGYGKMSPATVSGSDELNDGHLPAHSSHPRAPKPEKKKEK